MRYIFRSFEKFYSQFFQNLKSFNGYRALRAARNDARLVGIRLKQSKTEKEEKKGGAAGNADD